MQHLAVNVSMRWKKVRLAGDSITRLSAGPEQIGVKALFYLLHFDKKNAALARRALRIPALAAAWRGPLEKIAGGLVM